MNYIPCNLDAISNTFILNELSKVFIRMQLLMNYKITCLTEKQPDVLEETKAIYLGYYKNLPEWAKFNTIKPKHYYTPCNLDEINVEECRELLKVYELMYKITMCKLQCNFYAEENDLENLQIEKDKIEAHYNNLPDWAKFNCNKRSMNETAIYKTLLEKSLTNYIHSDWHETEGSDWTINLSFNNNTIHLHCQNVKEKLEANFEFDFLCELSEIEGKLLSLTMRERANIDKRSWNRKELDDAH